MSRRSTRTKASGAVVAKEESPRPEKEKTRARTPAVLRNLAPKHDSDDADDNWSAVLVVGAAKSTPEKKRKLAANRKKKPQHALGASGGGGGGAFSRERAQFLDEQRKFFSDVDLEEVATEQVTVLERRRRDDDARRAAAFKSPAVVDSAASPGGSAIQPKRTIADDNGNDDGALIAADETADGAPDEFRLHRGSAKRARRTKLQEKYPVIESTRTDAELQELDYVDSKGAKRRSSGSSATKRKATQ
jgi:hypothetical protein